MPLRLPIAFLAVAGTFLAGVAHAAPAPARTWSFAVSGDSRNCGNIVMPAIAARVREHGERFYWHLGDLRRIRGVDEDFVREQRFSATRPTLETYLREAWPDFTAHQVRAFGDTPFFLGIGNHETIAPKTRGEFEAEFRDLLDAPALKAQRVADVRRLHRPDEGPPHAYYHWIQDRVDFINLDNAIGDRFGEEQLGWFDAVVAAAVRDHHVRTLVVGMHEALPHSFSDHHSMCASTGGIESGEHVYRALVAAQRAGKHVYLLASHSHYYLENLYGTDYWKDPAHGGVVLPGWIVGTAGAVRYPLPADVEPGPGARAHVYGYLSGEVHGDGTIAFTYRELERADLKRTLSSDYTAADADFCFDENPAPGEMGRSPPAPSCLLGDHGH